MKKNDQVINLTVKEYDLLLLFIQNKNIVSFPLIEFMKRYGVIINMGDSRTVDLHVQANAKKAWIGR